MSKELLGKTIMKYLCGVLLLGLLLFLPAGTVSWDRGWLFMGILFVPMFVVGVVLMWKNPDLLRKRLQAKEKEQTQKVVILLSGLMFIGGFVLSGLSYRFDWLLLPNWVSGVATVIFLLAYAMYAEVMRENTYLSRTVEVQKGQKVIDTGLYGIVRHPMYSATLILFLAIPLVLGSLLGFVIFLLYPVLLVGRIRNEEAVLEAGLPGYTAYKEKVRWRLVPFFW